MKVISTFAGCGGSSTGYKMAGCEVVAMVEWDRHAVDCYALNHPTTKLFHGDINKIKGADLLKATGLKPGELDMLDGSPPCQGFSLAGQRVLDDPRNVLFQQQIRLIRALKPKYVVIENVAGMIKGRMKRVAGEIFRAIQAEGYQVTAGLVKAIAFGVPQTRPRVFFVGARDFKPRLPAPTHRIAVTAEQALEKIKPVILESDPPDLKVSAETSPISRWIMDNIRHGENGAALRERHGLSGTHFGHFMLHPKRPCPTIIKSSGPQFYHWDRRMLACNEALVLCGFPANYKLLGIRAKQFQRIGNCVAPPVTAAIANTLRKQANRQK